MNLQGNDIYIFPDLSDGKIKYKKSDGNIGELIYSGQDNIYNIKESFKIGTVYNTSNHDIKKVSIGKEMISIEMIPTGINFQPSDTKYAIHVDQKRRNDALNILTFGTIL